MSTMGGIYFILKPFEGASTIGFVSTTTMVDQDCGKRGSISRRKSRWKIWRIMKDRSSRSVTRDLRRRRLERLLQTKVSLVGLIRSMNVILTLNEFAFLLPFSGSKTFIAKYRTMPRLKRDLTIEQVKGNVIQ